MGGAQHALPGNGVDDAVYYGRARRIRQHPTFPRHLTAALKNRRADREPSPHHEATLYSGGFLSDADARVCSRWHNCPWISAEVSPSMGDYRLQAFTNRQIFLQAPECLSRKARRKGRDCANG